MATTKKWASILTAAAFVVCTYGVKTAEAGDPYCSQECVAKCDPDKPDCFIDCCEEACKKAGEACEKNVGEQKKLQEDQCKVSRKQDKQDCETTMVASLIQCDAIACLNDPNQDFKRCERAAKDAKYRCKDLAKSASEQCETNAKAAKEQDKDNCKLIESACEVACNTPAP